MLTLDVGMDINLKLLLLVAQAEPYYVKMHLFVWKDLGLHIIFIHSKHFVIYSILIIVELKCFSSPSGIMEIMLRIA